MYKNKGWLHQKGGKNSNAKLTWGKVRQIREEYATGEYTQKELAKKYNVDKTTIRDIINNKRWKE